METSNDFKLSIRTNDDKHHFKPLNNNYKISKPTIICLSGNSTIDTQSANGMAKMAENLIGVNNQDVDILTIVYRQNPNFKINCATFEDYEGKQIAENLLLPLVVNDKGDRLEYLEACKNVRNVNFFTFCFGNRVKDTIIYEFNYLLANKAYNKSECDQILKQIYCIGYAPMQNKDYNKSTNFYVKSFNDLMLGNSFYYEKFQDDYKPKNIGCGIIERNENTINLYTENLSPDDNHFLAIVNRDENWNLKYEQVNFTAEVASQCMAYALAKGVLNSIINYFSNKLTEIDLNNIVEECQSIIDSANISKKGVEINKLNNKKIEEYIRANTVFKFKDVLKELDIKETDILSGLIPINSFIKDFKGIVDYSGTVYNAPSNIKTTYIYDKANYRMFDKQEIYALEICDKFGFVTSNGELALCPQRKDIINLSLYHKLFNGLDLTNSIKIEIENINGENYLILSDNYGCRNNTNIKTAKALKKEWIELYDNCPLTITPSKKQRIAIKNFCTNYDISSNNIIYNSSQTMQI